MNIILDKGAYMPERAHDTDAGLDIKTPIDITVPPTTRYPYCDRAKVGFVVIDTGVHVELPVGAVGMLKSKSGLNVNKGIISEGVIDVGYSGSIVAKLYNLSDTPVEFKAGDKITQLVILPILTPELTLVDKFKETERGNGGFGSTGR